MKLKCKDCGKEPNKDKSKSNKNFNVYDNKPCEYCGGELGLSFDK